MSAPRKGLTREQWESGSPYEKGYFAYMEGAWNPNVPDTDKPPFAAGTKEREQYDRGAFEACMETQEGDD